MNIIETELIDKQTHVTFPVHFPIIWWDNHTHTYYQLTYSYITNTDHTLTDHCPRKCICHIDITRVIQAGDDVSQLDPLLSHWLHGPMIQRITAFNLQEFSLLWYRSITIFWYTATYAILHKDPKYWNKLWISYTTMWTSQSQEFLRTFFGTLQHTCGEHSESNSHIRVHANSHINRFMCRNS